MNHRRQSRWIVAFAFWLFCVGLSGAIAFFWSALSLHEIIRGRSEERKYFLVSEWKSDPQSGDREGVRRRIRWCEIRSGILALGFFEEQVPVQVYSYRQESGVTVRVEDSRPVSETFVYQIRWRVVLLLLVANFGLVLVVDRLFRVLTARGSPRLE